MKVKEKDDMIFFKKYMQSRKKKRIEKMQEEFNER